MVNWIKKQLGISLSVEQPPGEMPYLSARIEYPEEHDNTGLQYRPSQVRERQTDTLNGIAKGLIADGAVDHGEAEFLVNWLANNRFTESPMIDALLDEVGFMLRDGHLDEQERQDLYQLLSAFAGDPVTAGEVLQSTYLPLDYPPPLVIVQDHSFLFTGTCGFGSRRECEDFIAEGGGTTLANVSKRVDYLVIGKYVSKAWKHESYGRKIEKAMEYRERFGRPAIIPEDAIGFNT